MAESQEEAPMVAEPPKGEHYSEFETLYESVLFKKPELVTSKVFVNAMNELKVMKEKIREVSVEKDLLVVEEEMSKLYARVHKAFDQLDKESLAKLLINIKDKLQSKKPQETVAKIGKNIGDYLVQIKETGVDKEAGKTKKTGKEKKGAATKE